MNKWKTNIKSVIDVSEGGMGMTPQEAKLILIMHREWLLEPPYNTGGKCEEIAEAIQTVLNIVDRVGREK